MRLDVLKKPPEKSIFDAGPSIQKPVVASTIVLDEHTKARAVALRRTTIIEHLQFDAMESRRAAIQPC